MGLDEQICYYCPLPTDRFMDGWVYSGFISGWMGGGWIYGCEQLNEMADGYMDG